MNKKSTKVIYQTPDGKNREGYIIDGKTYNDYLGKERVEIGSTVPTAGGVYTYTGAGGVKTPRSIGDTLSEAYKTSRGALDDIHKAEADAIRYATENKKKGLYAQRKNIDERYGASNRAAYQAYVNASNPYGAAAEREAKLGLANSGYSETSKMRLANTYQQSIGENARERDAYMAELDRAIENAEYDGNIALANALAEHKKLVYQHGIDAAEAIAAQENKAYDAGIAANRDMYERDLNERKLKAEEEARAYERDFNERQLAFQRQDADRNYNLRRASASSGKSTPQNDWKQQADADERAQKAKQQAWENALELARRGVSNKEIAEILGISMEDLNRLARR